MDVGVISTKATLLLRNHQFVTINFFSDRNKKRHNVAVKIAQQKRRLLQKIEQYNQQSAADKVDVTTVQQKLSAKTPDSMIWPWEDHVTGM